MPNMGEQNRRFKGVWIPREVWLDPTMSLIEKALLVEIDSLDNENGCTAGNTYFAKFFQISERQIRRYITRLVDEGWVEAEMIGRNRRRLSIAKKLRILMDESVPTDGQKRPSADGQKRPHNNTKSNNTGLTKRQVAQGRFDGQEINNLIDLFITVNPEHQRLFANKTERGAMERLFDKYGREKCENMIREAARVIALDYAPVITTPLELEKRLSKLVVFIRREKGQKKSGISLAI